MKISRRMLIRNGGLGILSVGLSPVLGPAFIQRASGAVPAANHKKSLVCLFMRGAADGLSIVVPHGEEELYKSRPNIAIPKEQVIDLDGFFGLHPALEPLAEIYKQGHLAPIQACGSPSNSRSHFDAMDYMESGTPDNKLVHDGWLARTSLMCPQDQANHRSPFHALAIGGGLPRSLQGDPEALAIPDLRTFGIQDSQIKARINSGGPGAGAVNLSSQPPTVAGGFEALYDQAVGDVIHGTGRESFEAIRALGKINARSYTPDRGAVYPNGRLGDSFRQIAQLIKSNIGVEIAFTEVGGWDTHANQVQIGNPGIGTLATRLKEVGQALAAFYTDLGDRMSDVVVLTMSEFGRTVKQNGTGGTDHGHASCFFALGGPVKGGKVYGDWPGLSQEKLYEGRDLAMTTDFRSIFGEIAQKHLGVPDLDKLFPGFTGGKESFRGLIG